MEALFQAGLAKKTGLLLPQVPNEGLSQLEEQGASISHSLQLRFEEGELSSW